MNSRNNIQDELVALNSSLPANLHKPVFGLPEDYFENFASSVLEKLNKEDVLSVTDELSRLSPLLASVSKKSPYHVPENYFSTLSGDLPAVVSEDALPAVLAALSRDTPYKVPDGYFASLPQVMLNKVAPRQAKVIPMHTRWARMAAAAVVAGLISVGAFFYVNNQRSAGGSENWVVNNLQTISDQELDEFVKSAEVGREDVVQSGTTQKEMTRLLSDVSTTEMDAFLAQVPTDDEELLIIN